MQLNKKVLIGVGGCITACIGALGLAYMGQSQADLPSEPNYQQTAVSMKNINLEQLKAQGFWFDSERKLLWYRCHLGQTFDGQQCIGENKPLAFHQVQTQIDALNQQHWQGINQWRLADIHELHRLIECSTGFVDQTNLPNQNQVAHGCKPDGYQRPTINKNIFLATESDWYWSATAYQAASKGAAKTVWGAYLSSGYVYDLSIEQKGYVYVLSTVQ